MIFEEYKTYKRTGNTAEIEKWKSTRERELLALIWDNRIADQKYYSDQNFPLEEKPKTEVINRAEDNTKHMTIEEFKKASYLERLGVKQKDPNLYKELVSASKKK